MHIFSKLWPFLSTVFGPWQIWLSGGGLGGFIVIVVNLIERWVGKPLLSKSASIYLFIVMFFVCSCFLAWVPDVERTCVYLIDFMVT